MKRMDCDRMFVAKVRQRGFSCLLRLIAMFSIVSFCFPIKGYGVEETKMIEKFKRATPLYLSGQEYFVKENFQKSRKKLEKCIEIMPEYADAWLLLAQIENKENNLEKAMENIQKAKTNFKLSAEFQMYTHEQYIKNLRDQRVKLEERIFLFEGGVGDPNAPLSNEERQQLKRTIDEMKRNLEHVDKETRATDSKTIDIPAEYFFVHGNIFFKMKQFNEARDQYLETIQREPTHANAYNNLANLYLMTGYYQKALDYLNQAETNGVNVNQKLKDAVLAAQKNSCRS